MTDDDAAGITVSETTLTVAEAGGSGTFTVVLESQPTADVTIAVSSDATGNATVSPATLTFTSANWATAQTVTVTGVDDSIETPDRTASIVLTVTSGDAAFNGIDLANVAVTVTNDDFFDAVATAEVFQEVTGAFVRHRMDRIVASEPRGYRLDRRRQATGKTNATISSSGGGFLTFNSSHKSYDARWYAWVEGSYTVYSDTTGVAGKTEGKFGVLSFGADYLVNDRLSVGLMGQIDTTSENTSRNVRCVGQGLDGRSLCVGGAGA